VRTIREKANTKGPQQSNQWLRADTDGSGWLNRQLFVTLF